MSAVALLAAIERSDSLRERCLRYVELFMVQTSQAAAFNARHNLPERLARWLLMTRDTDHLPVTQELPRAIAIASFSEVGVALCLTCSIALSRKCALSYVNAALAWDCSAVDHEYWRDESNGELSIVIRGLWLVIRKSPDCARFLVFRGHPDSARPEVLLASDTEADVSAAK
jgi:hypothetical protein